MRQVLPVKDDEVPYYFCDTFWYSDIYKYAGNCMLNNMSLKSMNGQVQLFQKLMDSFVKLFS